MVVKFRTNIDRYKTNCFPERLDQVPRIGDKVQVVDVFQDYFKTKKLPTVLQVIDVIWAEGYAVCELSFTEMSLKIAAQNNTNLFEL